MLTPTIQASQTATTNAPFENRRGRASFPSPSQGEIHRGCAGDARSRSERTSPSIRQTSFRIAGRKRLQG